MATGGGSKPKMSSSEPRQRSSWQRTTSMSDKEDNISLNSMTNDLRPNNWDFSDWRPSSQKDQTKRRKKGNPEWEREQSVSQDSPPPSERQHGTPRTFPRTKITPSTPTSQRVALENLRQHMTFSDQEDDASNDGERNNERNVFRRRENLPGYTRQDVSNTTENQLTRPVPNKRDDRNNRNNNKQNQNEVHQTGKPDSSQIVGRLMQIRDYIKQASSMMESLRKSGDTPGYRDEMDRLQKLMDHLKEQERGYTGLLQTILSIREDSGINDISRELTPNLEPMDDTQSIDLDVVSEMSEREERSASASSRPRIEDKLGLTSDNDEDEGEIAAGQSESSDNSSNMDDTVISGQKNQEWDFELGQEELALGGVPNPKEAAETLVALKQQQELLTKLIEQQEQMRALRGRQAALLALQQDAESKLATAKQKSNEAHAYKQQLEETAVRMTNRADSLIATETNAGHQGDPDLQDIRQQLQYLRNELKSQNQNLQQGKSANSNLPSNANMKARTKNHAVPPPRPPAPKLAQAAARVPTQETEGQGDQVSKEHLTSRLNELLNTRQRMDRLLRDSSGPIAPPSEDMTKDQLENKLHELQEKKKRMDDMLEELFSNRAGLNNAKTAVGQSGLLARDEDGFVQTEGSENLADGAVGILEARQKLQKLNEVKERLSQLKGLVQYYQTVETSNTPQLDNEDESSLPAYSDYGADPEPTRDTGSSKSKREEKERDESTRPKVNVPVEVHSAGSHDDNNSSSSSDTESQLSSLGPWGDDPEIQEKVRKLKAAKEKLKYLQDLVAMVQHSPDVASEIPDNIAEIAASIEDVESQITQPDERNNSEGELPSQADGDTFYQSRMQEQLVELEQLKDEKTRLLAIQSQLQSLHNRFQMEEEQRAEEEENMNENMNLQEAQSKSQSGHQQNNHQDSTNQQSSGPSVTFSSNEEVYDKMRKQRMLREELRDKKKQLESIMKKDRNKKSYYKNQDNQSDTVSYSTEAFGASASVDATMATWGGSTVDNLESITEDGAADPENNEEDEDDAYPIDGILQVEEEEEENQSDNETYTIEEDVRQRRKARSMAKASNNDGNVRKNKRSFPRPQREGDGGVRPKESWTRPPDFSKWSRSGRKSRQENYRSAEDIVDDEEDSPMSKRHNSTVDELQHKLGEISMLCQSLSGDPYAAGPLARQTSAGFGSQLLPDFQQQLQQQQLMMSLNQCYQQISMQQMELQNMQRQMQNLAYQMPAGSDINESGLSSDMRVRSMPSLFSPLIPRQSPSMLQNDPFVFNPQYPSFLPGNSRLLRRAVNETDEDVFAAQEPLETSAARSRGTKSNRQSRSESYSQKSKTKKSLSPSMRSSQGLQQRAPAAEGARYEDEDNISLPEDRPVPTQKFEQYLARKKREFMERNKLPGRSQQQSSEPVRHGGMKGRSNEHSPLYRPGLSAGISGAGYQEDGRSVASSVQSSLAAMAQALNSQSDKREQRDSEDDNPNEMSLFETLRETIYSEVATLISQNENRPHYLIELFRELQLLTTDYLRQRVLYDIKDVVSKYLVEENAISAPPPPWMNTAVSNFNASELTPSESLVTSDDEEVKTKLKERVAANLVAKERERLQQHRSVAMARSGSLKDDKYDYQEVAEITSSVSTPSNSYWDSPFNQDSLGETAINLDKTIEKMREYERKLAEKDAKVKAYTEGRGIPETTEGCSSSAMDQGSESSAASDSVPYPRIDTQQLDQQIKSIMTEVIPVIKEHMDNMCSPQLLAYIKRLVLSLTRQYDSGQEFARFFHRQLGSILQDSLAKYEGRKMRECGEDLLVDMSEVLFNELAFFRLMQDLDDPLIAEKMRKAQSQDEKDKDSAEEDDDDEEDDDEDDDSDTTESSTANASDNQDDTRPTNTEEEELGKARDDALASAMEIQDAEDKDESPESLFKGVQIELAPSETKPYTRIGSDEDDESADDETQSNEDPSETAVSINARRVNYIDDNEDDGTRQDGTAPAVSNEDSEGRQAHAQPLPQQDQNRDADQGAASSGKLEPEVTDHLNGDINGDILNGDIEVITMDDLPPAMTIMSSEELQQKVSQEQQSNSGASAVLNTLETKEELAGDPQHLKEPDESSC